MLRECDTLSYRDIGLEKLAKSTDVVLTERDSIAFTWRHINVETDRNDNGSGKWNVMYLNDVDYETHFENLDLDSLSTTEYFLKLRVKKYDAPEFKVLEVLKVEKRKGKTSTLICNSNWQQSIFDRST